MQDAWRDKRSVAESGMSFAYFQQPPQPPGFTSEGLRHSPPSWIAPGRVPEPSSAPSMGRACATSGVAYPSDGGSFQEVVRSPESSGQSGSVLKEHDYIGLAEISSEAASGVGEEKGRAVCLYLEEPDLRLGLGPLTEACSLSKVVPRTQDTSSALESNMEAMGAEARNETAWTGRSQATRFLQEAPKPERVVGDAQRGRQISSSTQTRNAGQISRGAHALVDGFPDHGVLQYAFQAPIVPSRDSAAAQVSIPGQDFEGQRPASLSVTVDSRLRVPPSKNGVKRGYSEAMADRAKCYYNDSSSGVSGVTLAPPVAKTGLELHEAEVNALQKHQQASFLSSWSASKPVVPGPWNTGLENMPNFKSASLPPLVVSDQVHTSNNLPPQKGQVVGWPPVGSFRKNTLAAHPKPSGGEVDGKKSVAGQSLSPNFVKVNMDGITVGRKVDLNAHTCYEGLLTALEEMFQPSICGQSGSGRDSLATGLKHLRLLKGSDFVLTHEDNEGDWMLVGDVPWGMFVNTVRRLRIMRGSDATGLIPRGPEKRNSNV